MLEDMTIHNIKWTPDNRVGQKKFTGNISTGYDPNEEVATLHTNKKAFIYSCYAGRVRKLQRTSSHQRLHSEPSNDNNGRGEFHKPGISRELSGRKLEQQP